MMFSFRCSAAPRALFLSGCPGQSMQYRCHHAAMVLRSMGWKTRVHAGDLPEAGVEGQYDLVVLHRVPFSAELKQFLMLLSFLLT